MICKYGESPVYKCMLYYMYTYILCHNILRLSYVMWVINKVIDYPAHLLESDIKVHSCILGFGRCPSRHFWKFAKYFSWLVHKLVHKLKSQDPTALKHVSIISGAEFYLFIFGERCLQYGFI